MSVEITCPRCGRSFKIKDSQVGRRDACKHCGKIIHFVTGQSAAPMSRPAQVIAPPTRPALTRPAPSLEPIDLANARPEVLTPRGKSAGPAPVVAPPALPTRGGPRPTGQTPVPPPIRTTPPSQAQWPSVQNLSEDPSFKPSQLLARLRMDPLVCPNCFGGDIRRTQQYAEYGKIVETSICGRCACTWTSDTTKPAAAIMVIIVLAVAACLALLAFGSGRMCAAILVPIIVAIKLVNSVSKKGQTQFKIIFPGREGEIPSEESQP